MSSKLILKFAFSFFVVSAFLACNTVNSKVSDTIDQHIHATLDIANSSIEVTDTVYIPKHIWDSWEDQTFMLNSALIIDSDKSNSFELVDPENDGKQTKYKITPPIESTSQGMMIVFHYSGVIKEEIVAGAAEYARGFSDTDGLISEDGVYLAGASFWLPAFNVKDLSTFTLNVTLDEGWNVVSQGTRTQNELDNGKQIVRYECDKPMNETYLIAARWTEYDTTANNILVQAFLRNPDPELAQRYLGVTSDYLQLYEKLIGPYPFTKFALVENFWETGFGMPSFTLLGEKVIRFPWILHSSYPHELLHNYWGNSVYVDYAGGNWCEGITAYMADHLIKEQQGLGADYRRSTLEKFTNYVNADNDFPVNQFRSRNNSAEEAIGYGKVLMMNNMLRELVGDENYLKAYAKFYQDYKFQYASFNDIRTSFEAVTGLDLKAFFDQWVNRTGAPEIKLSDVKVKSSEGKYELTFNLNQTQDEEAFALDVPVAIYLEADSSVVTESLKMEGKSQQFVFSFDKRPLSIQVDPEFNLMRRLDNSEIPATLSLVFGQKQAMLVLPSKSKFLKDYESLAKIWKESQDAQGNKLDIVLDNKIETLPDDRGVWIIGFENKFNSLPDFIKENKNNIDPEQLAGIADLSKSGSLVFVANNEMNPDFPVGFVGANSAGAIEGLIRKLPHYGKYSLLGFEGESAQNSLKATLPVSSSKLQYTIPYAEETGEIIARLKPRKALSGI
ncbi:MAG: hypothetical protein K9H62_03130 [Bacteroidales bacterium]|nr:hypothetical protein [Bacteroidales bacterium]